MLTLLAGPGGLWLLVGAGAWGLAAGMLLARAAGERVWWACLVAAPLGLAAYPLALIPAFALLAPPVAPVAAALAGAALLVALAVTLAGGTTSWRRAGTRPLPDDRSRWDRPVPYSALASGIARSSSLVDWLAVAAIGCAATLVAFGAARLSHAVLLNAPLPPIMGGTSTGDMGLHALRVAMIARQGVPPPSPLDPDYPLQYRYAFHLLAAALAAPGRADTAAATAVASGLVAGALVLAGAALGQLWTRSWSASLVAGLLAALYGPSYWLPDALRLVASGRWSGVSDLDALMGGAWSMSPLTPSFPSILSAQESSPGIPAAALAWLAVLCCGGAAVRARGRWRAAAAALSGIYLGALAFTADFFLPLALIALATGAAYAIWLAFSSPFGAYAERGTNVSASQHASRMLKACREPAEFVGSLPTRQFQGRHFVLPLIAGLLLGLGLTFGVTGQVGGAGAARDVRLAWNSTAGLTPVYGGNHAMLAGGEPRALPNWPAIHDWGVLFWPGAVLAVVGGLRKREPALLAAALAASGTAVFWHLFTVTYESGTPTDLRAQMYRYAGMATACLAPLLPVGLHACLSPTNDKGPDPTLPSESALGLPKWRARSVPAAPRLREQFIPSSLFFVPLSSLVWAASLVAMVFVGGGAGFYLLAGAAHLRPAPRPEQAGDAAMAGVLARQQGARQVYRLAMLGGPDSFLGMYHDRAGYLPLWWALGGAAVPVGWDFGHPEYYQPLYRRVVADYDPRAAALLGLTHVALAPGHLSPPARAAVEALLARCHGQLVAEWGAADTPAGRRLYRIDADACRSEED